MDGDGLIGTWRKLAVNGEPLTRGYELLRLNPDGTASIECGWDGEVSTTAHRWQRLDDRRWRLDILIPAGALPGVPDEVVVPGPSHIILALTDTTMRLTTEFPEEVREEARRQLVEGGHLGPSDPLPPDDVYDYERVL